jgi:hypothetical protein
MIAANIQSAAGGHSQHLAKAHWHLLLVELGFDVPVPAGVRIAKLNHL